MKAEGKTFFAGAGGVTAAFVSALCCAGPLIAVAAGVSAAGLVSTFEPLRPYFLGVTAGLLLLGFWILHREERRACEAGNACAAPRVRRRMKIVLWTATVLAVVFATFPSWQTLIL
jgi:mercuric ion transport protein